MIEISFLALFLMGLFGGGHCVAMCGGLSGAFVLQLPPGTRRWPLILMLNIGRVVSYVTIGALLGGFGQLGLSLDQTQTLQHVLFFLANALLVLLGLFLLGVSGLIAKVEGLGRPLWRYLNRYLQKLLPIRSLRAALVTGMIWGWLPCGMVYTASIYALGSGSFSTGALCMLAFAAGTLPNLLGIGLLAVRFQRFLQNKPVRMLTGLLLIGFAVWQSVSFLLHRLG